MSTGEKQSTVPASALIETLGGKAMTKFQTLTCRLAQACEGNPVMSTILVMLFYLMFGMVEATVETLIWGNRFVHFMDDPVFSLMFMAYAAYAVWWCAVLNSSKKTT